MQTGAFDDIFDLRPKRSPRSVVRSLLVFRLRGSTAGMAWTGQKRPSKGAVLMSDFECARC